MYLHRLTVGILFNEKMFRINSLHGLVTDKILGLRGNNSIIPSNYYTKVSNITTSTREMNLSVHNDSGHNSFQIRPQEVIFKKVSSEEGVSVDISKAINELKELWKASNKVMEFPATRRLGFVAEYRIPEKSEGSSCKQLIKSLSKFSEPGNSTSFMLTFENTSLGPDGKVHNKTTDQFWNTILSFYNSERDESPVDGYINANIDVQRFFAPAKLDPVKEFKTLEKRFEIERKRFLEQMNEMGLSAK